MGTPKLQMKIDVNTLFGQTRPSVQGVAGKGIQADLALLHTLESGQQTSPFSAEDTAHFQQVSDTYLRDHPLGFLAKNNPIIAQSMLQDALRRDVTQLMGAYNFANGHFQERDAAIAALHTVGSEHFAMATQQTMTEIHRDVLVKAAKDMKGMAHTIDDDLWGTSAHDERAMKYQFEHSAQQLEKALALFDQGQTEAALALYAEVMGDTDGTAAWFGRALRTSEKQKFAAHVGIAMAAGAAAYFTGGASLALMGGQEAALGAHVTSMLVGGAGMTVTSRGLNAAVFNETFFIPGTTLDKAVDFGGEVLHNTALMGALKLGNIAGASLPVMDGEPVIAASINAARSFAIEFGSFTSFNMVSSISHEFDARQPSIDDVLSKQSLIENAAFILGLRVGHMGLNAAKFMTRRGLNVAIDLDTRVAKFMRSAQTARFLLSPLVLFAGIPSGGGTPGSAVSDSFATLLQTLGTKPNVIDIYQRRPYKFWGILNLLDMGIPPALVAYRVLRLQVDTQSRSLMNEFQTLLGDSKIKDSLRDIRERGMRAYLAANGVNVTVDKFKNGADWMDRLAIAYGQMQGYIDRYSAAATAAGHIVGMEYEGRTHFKAYEEVVWPDDEVFTPRSEATGPSVRDRLAIALKDDLIAKNHDAELVRGKDFFGYTASPIVFPTIFERYKVGNNVVKVEFLTGTGAVIISVIPDNDPSKSKTEHVKGAKTVFDPAVDLKAAEMIARALQLNTDDEAPEDAIAILRKTEGKYDRRYLIQAKATDNDILKIWVEFNEDGTATLDPINGVLCNEKGEYVPGTLTIQAKNYEEAQKYITDRAASNSVFAKKSDKYEGVRITGFGVVLLTDEAHPYKEIVSPKLTFDKFDTWFDVVKSLGNMGITGTTPYNLVGIHMHGNLPMTLNPVTDSKFTILPAFGILRAFVNDGDMLYDGIPSHDNRLGFIQRLPLWLRERLLDPTYITDPTDRRQVLRLAADLARDVKKYNAMNLANHISSFLAKMIEKGIFQDGEDESISSRWEEEVYNFRVTAGALPESHDIIREVDCAGYRISTTDGRFEITDREVRESWVNDRIARFFNSSLYDFNEKKDFANLQIGKSFQRTVKFQGDDFQFKATRTTPDTISVEVKQQVHLIRVAKDARKTTGEIRIPDAIFDRDTGRFLLNFYHAWSWWHGTGQYLNSPQVSSTPPIVEGGAMVFGAPSENSD